MQRRVFDGVRRSGPTSFQPNLSLSRPGSRLLLDCVVRLLDGVKQSGSSTFVASFSLTLRRTHPGRQVCPFKTKHVAFYLDILLLLAVFEGDPKFRLFVKSKFISFFFLAVLFVLMTLIYRKHPLYLNPRLIYLIFSQIVAALVYTFRNVLLDRFLFRFAPPSSPQRLISAFTVLHALVICTIITTLSTPLTCIAFGLSRLALPLLYRLPLLPYLLKSFTAHFLEGTWNLWTNSHSFFEDGL